MSGDVNRGNTFRAGRWALASALACFLLAGTLGTHAAAAEAAEGTGVRMGAPVSNIIVLDEAGVRPDYGSVWAGPWSKTKWHEVEDAIDTAHAHDVTPVVHWYYWGDDISPECVEDGCWSDLHNTEKSRAEWDAMAVTLAQKIGARDGGEDVIVVLETEFNKGGIESWEPFDGYLADQAAIFREHAPHATLVLGFGSWRYDGYANFDRAIAASDWLGFQDLAGTTRDSDETMRGTVDRLLATSRVLNEEFGKPTFLAHFAVSTFGGEKYEAMQADVLHEFFERLPEFEAAGMVGFLYRDLVDNPNFDTANYYGEGERHWGLLHANGTAKPALDVWVHGVQELQPEPEPEEAVLEQTAAAMGVATAPAGEDAAHAVPVFAAMLAVTLLAAVMCTPRARAFVADAASRARDAWQARAARAQ